MGRRSVVGVIGAMAWPALIVALALSGRSKAVGQGDVAPNPPFSPPAPTIDNGPRPQPELISTLDRLCQERFETVDYKNFGLSRIPRFEVPMHEGLLRWKPDLPAEKSTLTDMQQDGWDAILLVAGQRALTVAGSLKTAEAPHPAQQGAVSAAIGQAASPSAAPAQAAAPPTLAALINRRAISAPMVLTSDKPRAALPKAEALIPEVVRAFAAFRSQPGYSFRAGDWYVSARPIRAEKRECLSCHQKMSDGAAMHLGDAVGVALYGFASR